MIYRLFVILPFIVSLLGFVPHVSAQTAELSNALHQLSNDVRYFTLSNGLRVIMYRRGMAPVFSGVVAVRVGGTDEQKGATGISHMFEHMAFKGTSVIGTRDYEREKLLLAELETLITSAGNTVKGLSPDQKKRWDEINRELQGYWTTEEFTREYEKRGASGMNATTDSELTRYFVSLPRSEFEFWCLMESARLFDPVLRQFYQERDVVLEERRMRSEDSPQGALYERLLDVAFTTHPYRFPVIGYPQDLHHLTATATDEFRKRYYVPNNIVIGLVGDVDPGRDAAIVERYFGRLPVGPAPQRPTEVEPPQTHAREFVLPFPASPEQLIAYHKPIYPHPDDAVFSVISELIGGSAVSPLYVELVKKRRLATSVSVHEAPGNSYPNLLIFALSPRAPHGNKAVLTAFDEVLAQFIKDGVTEERLQEAKRALSVEYLGQLRSSQSLAIDLASNELLHGSWRAVIDWFDQIHRVSIADINRVLKTYLVPSNRTVGRVETARGPKQTAVKG